MIRFKTLSLRNFLCFGNVTTTIELDKPGTTLVLGQDLDNTDHGTGTNGTGKSAIINGLTYAVYDKPLADISKDNLINNINRKNMQVTVEFEKGNDSYQIIRARKMKSGPSGNYVQLFQNGEDITPDSVKNTNALIEQIMGIPHELFVRIVAFSATHVPFLDLPVRSAQSANQTDVIEELFDLKALSQKADMLKEQIKQTEQSIEIQQNHVEQLQKEHERHEKQIENTQNRVDKWEQDRQNQIDQIRQKLSRVENVDIDHQKNLYDQLTDLKQQLDRYNTQRKDVDKQIEQQQQTIEQKHTELQYLESETCPYCMQRYHSEQQKEQCQQSLQQAQENLEQLQQQKQQVDQDLDQLAQQYEQIEQQITVKNLDELIEIKNKYDVYQNQLEELQNQTNPHLEPLQELHETELEPVDSTTLNELRSTLEHQKFLLKLLTKKDSFVRKALLDKNLPFLNQRLAQYLSDLGLPHKVEFTHEMTASISQFDRPLDFGSLSNGQRARVNLALSFAFRDVLQSMHQNINVCMLDEVLDVGLDSIGVQSAAQMIKRKARDEDLSIYCISHRDEIDAFDRTLTVSMQKGFSHVLVNE